MEEMNDSLLKKAEESKQQVTVSAPVQEKPTMTSSNYTLHVPGEKIQGDVLTFSAATKQELFNVLDKALIAIEYDQKDRFRPERMGTGIPLPADERHLSFHADRN